MTAALSGSDFGSVVGRGDPALSVPTGSVVTDDDTQPHLRHGNQSFRQITCGKINAR